MSYPSRRERNTLTRQLKEFAREQSPMFVEGLVDAMEVKQSYLLFDRMPDGISLEGHLDYDETRIDLGFYATRYLRDDGKKADYGFNIWLTGSRLLHPRQLRLSDDSWERLQYQYLEDGSRHDVEPIGDVDDIEPLTDQEVRDEIIDEIIETGDSCEVYQNVGYSFSTAEPGIESSYERGVKVDDTAFDIYSTHGANDLDEDWEAVETADGDTIYVPPKLHDDELSIGDEIEVRSQFIDLIRGLHLDTESSMDQLIPHDDKMIQMMFLVDCMRRRRIDIR